MAINLQSMGIGAGAGLNGIAGASLTPAPIGVRAQSPTLPQLNNSLPKTQAVNDLSSKYANVDGTIYDKNTGTAFSNPQDFYKASGTNTFNNTKFDTSWKPVSNQPPSMMNTATQNLTPAIPAPPIPAPAPATGNYTPPNQGTTGVSQGGIVGNLLNQGNGQQSQAVTDATNALKTDEQQQASQIAAYGGVGDSNLALGRTGLVNQLYASKIAADQAAVQNALSSQGQQFGQTTAAASANAPIIATPGQVQINPSTPTLGATTSGAANLNSLIGTRMGSTGTTEYYNTSTGQGFATPQALADFINQQNPGANTNASNVFQYLKQNGQGGSNLLGLDSNTMATYAQMLASGQQASIPSSVTGNMALMAQLYQQAKALSGGNFNTNVAAGQGAANASNAQTAGTANTTAYSGILQQAKNDQANLQSNVSLMSNFGQQVLSNLQGLNPTDSAALNGTIQDFTQKYATDPRYSALLTNIQGFQARVSALLNAGEIPSAATTGASLIANGALPMSSMQATVNQLNNEANAMLTTQQAKVDAAQANLSNSSSISNSNSSAPGGWGWTG